MISELFAILSTPDLERALGFYGDILGGRVSYAFPGDDGSPTYVGMEIGRSHLGIGRAPGTGSPSGPRPMSLWLYTDHCDALVERIRASGATVIEEPTDQPWGERVARVRDPDGNDVLIGQRRPELGQETA